MRIDVCTCVFVCVQVEEWEDDVAEDEEEEEYDDEEEVEDSEDLPQDDNVVSSHVLVSSI